MIAYFLLPLFFRGQLFSAYEVLQHRFGGATKSVASLVFLVTRNVGDGLRLFLTALVLMVLINVPLPWCVVIVGVSTVVYTFAGGIKSVVWSDCIQLVVYLAGAVLTLVIILNRLPDGWSGFVTFAQATGKFRIVDGSLDLRSNFTFWSGLLGGAFLALGTHGTDQMMVQRYLCARSQRDAGLALISSGVVVILQFALFLLLGATLACFYAEVRSTVRFENTDRVLTTFIVDELPAGWGLIGIILAAIFAAAMSTLSGSLNSSASAALHDLYLPCLRQRPTDQHLLWVSRAFTVLFGILQIGIGIIAQYWATAVVNDVLAIASFSVGLLLGIFALGVFTHRVGQRAALVGLLAGLLVLTWTKFGTPVAYTWYAVIGATVTFGTGLLASYVWPARTPRFSTALVVIFFIGSSCAAAGDQPCRLPRSEPDTVGMSAEKLGEVDAAVRKALEQGRMPGCVVAIGRQGKLVYLRAFGDRQLQPNRVAMTTDTVFDLASLTKPIATATSVLRLVQDGKVDLDAPVATYLPEFGNRGKEAITRAATADAPWRSHTGQRTGRLRGRAGQGLGANLRFGTAGQAGYGLHLQRCRFHSVRRTRAASERQGARPVRTRRHLPATRHV